MKRTLIIGDVHGCSAELMRLLEAAQLSRDDRVIFVGDLINKGPDSRGVLEIARDLNAEVVMGNHERSFLKYIKKARTDDPEFEAIKDQLGDRLKGWVKWLKALPYYLETPDFLIVHGGLQPGLHPRDTRKRILANIRTWDGTGAVLEREGDPPWFDLYHGEKLVVFGHWALRGLVWRRNAVGLDTGCVYGHTLSGLILPERRLIQVPAARVYHKPKRILI